MPNSLKCRLKKLVHKGLLSEKDLSRIYTDKDVVKKLESLKPEIENIRDVEVTDGIIYANEFDVFDILDKHISELKGENNASEQVEKKCETCKYWNGGYVTFVCCECKDKSEWKQN